MKRPDRAGTCSTASPSLVSHFHIRSGTPSSRMLACVCALVCAASVQAADLLGILPRGNDGHPLNLDFEDGTLRNWHSEGRTFEKQPIKGDTVSARRSDMRSDHQGQYWIGTFEISGDEPEGTLTS